MMIIASHDALEREMGWQVGTLAHAWQQWNGREEGIDPPGMAQDSQRRGCYEA